MRRIIKAISAFAALASLMLILTACAAAPTGTVTVDGTPETAAQAQPAAQTGEALQQAPEEGGIMGMLTLILPFALMFLVMYFLIIRPQRRQVKEARTMQESLKVGENVMTTSGFFGKIVGVGTDSFLIEFGEGRGFKVWVRKVDIAGIKSPVTTALKDDDAKNDK